MKAIGNTYHVGCFSCVECNKAFSNGDKQGAYPIENKLYCYEHALRRAQEAKKAQLAQQKQ
jgi:hypothetical protein